MDDTQTRQIYKLAQLRLMIAAATVQTLLRKANFNPDQPRVPAGEPGGGRWTDGGVLSASYRTTDYVDLRLEEGKLGAHTLRKHVGKTDADLLLGMAPTGNRWWPPIQFVIYRNGSFFSIEDANSYVNDTLRANASTVKLVADGFFGEDTVFLKLRIGRKIGREAFRNDKRCNVFQDNG